ncbi:hypothetical protein TRVL_07018 [Trypanosoma vivax]|nr:hypothetical protein TRVL_07018 [Trypanosoma vivax]
MRNVRIVFQKQASKVANGSSGRKRYPHVSTAPTLSKIRLPRATSRTIRSSRAFFPLKATVQPTPGTCRQMYPRRLAFTIRGICDQTFLSFLVFASTHKTFGVLHGTPSHDDTELIQHCARSSVSSRWRIAGNSP